MATGDAYGALDYGIAVRAQLRDQAVEVAGAPAEVIHLAKLIVENDPDGAACALFASLVEGAPNDFELAELECLYEGWKRASRRDRRPFGPEATPDGGARSRLLGRSVTRASAGGT